MSESDTKNGQARHLIAKGAVANGNTEKTAHSLPKLVIYALRSRESDMGQSFHLQVFLRFFSGCIIKRKIVENKQVNKTKTENR